MDRESGQRPAGANPRHNNVPDLLIQYGLCDDEDADIKVFKSG